MHTEVAKKSAVIKIQTQVFIVLSFILLTETLFAQSRAKITGKLRKWHTITITFDGPHVSETDAFNPFLGYRLDVTFHRKGSKKEYKVPGYFAADGRAAETSATSGNKWRVHFTPNKIGKWEYKASFRRGDSVAINPSLTAGSPVSFNGISGIFNVSESDKSDRGKGMLRYVGERYLRFDNGDWFMKGGADAPETLLAYKDFDGTFLQKKTATHNSNNELIWKINPRDDDRHHAAPLKSYNAHIQDWKRGDPVWQNDKGKGLIGAINYLAKKGMNAFSFLTMTVNGDGRNVWPWITYKKSDHYYMELDRYDVSKLAQWELIFDHADHLGMFMHFKTQETEIETLLDGGKLGPTRKLYYRELVARFSHHNALNWNLGEEFDIWEELDDPEMNFAKSYAQYLHKIDPYNHPVVVHSFPNQYSEVYGPILGYKYIEGASIQTNNMRPWNNFDRINTLVQKTHDSGRLWNISLDEPGSADLGVSTDDWDDNYNQDDARAVYWATIAAGADGIEWYFGYSEAHNDLNAEDWRSRDALWDYTRYAMDFYRDNDIPFWEMKNANSLTRSKKDFVFAKPGEVYVIYLPDGGACSLDLKNYTNTFSINWYNPRRGGELQRGRNSEVPQTYSREPASVLSTVPNIKQPITRNGQVFEVEGPGLISLGIPPVENEEENDWVILVRKIKK